MSEELFKSLGGRAEVVMGNDPNDPENVIWNFGLNPITQPVEQLIQNTPTLHSMFPKMQGKWDGKNVNHWAAVDKVGNAQGFNPEDLIHYQPRGTCGGRAGAFVLDMLQCIMIAGGADAKFKRVSHAAVYYIARKLFGMINGGDWRNDNNDGVASGSVPKALAMMGASNRIETNDLKWYGEGSDDLACQLAVGMHPELAKKILEFGQDNLVTAWAPVKSAQELADGIAAGGVGIGSDMQGFTMTRDRDGFCRPSGQWAHYHVRCSVGVFNGRKGFGYNQSWGKGTPSGTGLAGHPGNCFGVDWDVQDRLCKSGQYAVLFSFPLWELNEGGKDIPWIFA